MDWQETDERNPSSLDLNRIVTRRAISVPARGKRLYSPTTGSHFFVKVSLTAVPRGKGLVLLVFDSSVSLEKILKNRFSVISSSPGYYSSLPYVIMKTECSCGHVCPTYRPRFSSRTAGPILTKFDINILSLKSAINTCTLISSCRVKARVKVKLTFSVSWCMAWGHTGERRYSHTHSEPRQVLTTSA